MGTNKQVFASNPERSNFYKLSRQWGSKYRLYHNLPFLNVFNTKGLINPKKLGSFASFFDPSEPDRLTIGDIDFNRLKKTSIDFTLCDEDDKPLVCIEFDGLKDGFNVGTEYRFDGPPDPWRELITGLKLRVAHGSVFPYFVVGTEHFKDLAADVQLTMVDGIIGEVLAALESGNRIGQGFRPDEVGWTQDDFDGLPPDEQHEIVQDWVIGVEVEAGLRNNPISVAVAELERTVSAHCACTWLTYPSADGVKSLQERRRLLDSAVSNGCRCTLHSGTAVKGGTVTHLPHPCGPVSATVWLPNFKTPGCGTLLGLVENLSKLVVLSQAKRSIDGTGA
jgi:hypothetical protein